MLPPPPPVDGVADDEDDEYATDSELLPPTEAPGPLFSGVACGACWKHTQRPDCSMCTTSMLNGVNSKECEHGAVMYLVLKSANPAHRVSRGIMMSILTS